MFKCNLARVSAVLILGTIASYAQTVSSSVLGIVVDPAGSVVPGAEIKLTNLGTAAVQNAVSEASGFFRITNIPPGSYSVAVLAKGFKLLSINSVEVGISDAHDLGKIALTLGNVTESISVTGEIAAVQTASS